LKVLKERNIFGSPKKGIFLEVLKKRNIFGGP